MPLLPNHFQPFGGRRIQRLFLLPALALLFSCGGGGNGLSSKSGGKRDIKQILKERAQNGDDGEREGGKSKKGARGGGSCSSYGDDDDLSVREFEYVDASNVGEYRLRGRCRDRDRLVSIEVNGYPINDNPYCHRKRWEVFLDLTPIADEGNMVSFRISHAGSEICRDVRVAFTGPKNYVPISSRADSFETGFYVMKYEAKLDKAGANSKAVSLPEGRPITRVSHAEAVRLCQNNGSRYDLITNAQWQNVARAIEDIDENWSLGRARAMEGNMLNCGVTSGLKEASSNDDNDCAGSRCGSGWHVNRRTHYLEKGHRIWDMCGNAAEIMKDKNTRKFNFDGAVYLMTGDLKKLFGPKKKYDVLQGSRSSRRHSHWGMGYAKTRSGSGDMIIRGGQVNRRYMGIFSVDLTKKQSGRVSSAGSIGFRCVFNP